MKKYVLRDKKTCLKCEYFQRKKRLDKSNHLLAYDYCDSFEQELFSLKACPRFCYAPDYQPETKYSSFIVPSGFTVIFGIIFMVIESIYVNSSVWGMGIIITGIISLMIFIHLDKKEANKH